jgi:hypothetical protein
VPTKRRKRGARQIGISAEAIAAWQAGNYWALWRELHLKLWQMPDWNCDPPEQLAPALPGFEAAPDTTALKAALIELAGPPPRRWIYSK